MDKVKNVVVERPFVWHQAVPCVLRAGQYCMQAGSDPNTKEPAGNRAIDVAASAQKRDIVELLLPCTSPSKEGEWTVDAVMERGAAADAEQQKHHHHHGHDHGDCCGCGHEHEHAEEQVRAAPHVLNNIPHKCKGAESRDTTRATSSSCQYCSYQHQHEHHGCSKYGYEDRHVELQVHGF